MFNVNFSFDKKSRNLIERLVAALDKIANRLPKPNPIGELKLMIKVKDNNPDVAFNLTAGEVKDEEGNVIDNADLDIVVESTDPEVLEVTQDSANELAGTVHFGKPGQATFRASASSAGNLLAAAAVDFVVTTGDPASIGNFGVTFDGLTDEQPAPPAEAPAPEAPAPSGIV